LRHKIMNIAIKNNPIEFTVYFLYLIVIELIRFKNSKLLVNFKGKSLPFVYQIRGYHFNY